MNRTSWGSSNTALQRLLPPEYEDGVETPRTSGLPSPREVSAASISHQNKWVHYFQCKSTPRVLNRVICGLGKIIAQWPTPLNRSPCSNEKFFQHHPPQGKWEVHIDADAVGSVCGPRHHPHSHCARRGRDRNPVLRRCGGDPLQERPPPSLLPYWYPRQWQNVQQGDPTSNFYILTLSILSSLVRSAWSLWGQCRHQGNIHFEANIIIVILLKPCSREGCNFGPREQVWWWWESKYLITQMLHKGKNCWVFIKNKCNQAIRWKYYI